MPLAALFTRDDGTRNVPGTDSPWDAWVSASKTRNYLLGDPLLDWLNVHGEAKGFKRDASDPKTDFGLFVLRKGIAFEAAVLKHLGGRHRLAVVSKDDRGAARSEAAVRRTWEAMLAGEEVIAQAPLWNPQTQTYGVLDLLVRSDILAALFPGQLGAEAELPAPDIPGAKWHYRVVDVKFSGLGLLKNGHADAGHLHYGAQVWIYNVALGRLQGYTPPSAYLLGRGWQQLNERGHSATERLSRIDHTFTTRDGAALGDLALAACDWIRRVRLQGAAWNVLPTPSVPDLRPNMRFGEDAPWHSAKKQIAEALEDLTILPRVSPDKRNNALSGGLLGWRDPSCSAARLGITGDTYRPQVDAGDLRSTGDVRRG